MPSIWLGCLQVENEGPESHVQKNSQTKTQGQPPVLAQPTLSTLLYSEAKKLTLHKNSSFRDKVLNFYLPLSRKHHADSL